MKHLPAATPNGSGAPALRGSSWTREATATRGSSWTREATATRGSSWTREATATRGSSWTRTASKVTAVLAAATAALVPTAGAAMAASAPARSTAAPLSAVVQVVPGHLAEVERAVIAAGGTVTRRMAALQTLSVQLTPAAAALLRSDADVVSVVPDRRVKLAGTSYDATADANSLLNIRKETGAQQVWTRSTGAGVDVALIDSGVSPVKGLDARRVVNGPDLSFESNNKDLRYLDTFGHGTHMAGIILGSDAASGAPTGDDAFAGIAPSARLVSLKVADARGATDVTQVLAAIDWVISHKNDNGLNIRVLNLSFGTDSSQGYGKDPLAQAVEAAWAAGITVVTSAGNAGTSIGRLTMPAVDPFVLAVGASDSNGTVNPSDDTVASFSSQGDGVRNPDLLAPGRSVQSLRVPGSYIDNTYAGSGAINDRFFRGSGTSQSAAVVSGAAALLLSVKPDLSPDQVKAALVGSATPLPGVSDRAQGAGELNLPAAAKLAANGGNGSGLQGFAASAGNGSLDASRGSMRLSLEGKVLNGERDIMGKAYDTKKAAKERTNGKAWTGGTYNGTVADRFVVGRQQLGRVRPGPAAAGPGPPGPAAAGPGPPGPAARGPAAAGPTATGAAARGLAAAGPGPPGLAAAGPGPRGPVRAGTSSSCRRSGSGLHVPNS